MRAATTVAPTVQSRARRSRSNVIHVGGGLSQFRRVAVSQSSEK